MTPLLADERFRWIDIDEVKNRIVFGVDDTRIRSELLAAAERRGVPSQALDVVAAEAVADRSDVRDRLRPVPGGVKIDRPGSTDDLCTLGFSAYQSETRYFVTASHCSTSTYRTDGTIQYQSSDNRPADAIGFEANDPPYSWFSRFSDAALYEYEIPFDSVAWGRIAHPQYYSVNQPGSIEIDTVTPNFRIVSKGENSDQLVGEVVNKVGMISGWTQGQITQTCVTRQGLFCQWVALVYSQVGDSGSPVFQQVDPQGSYPEDVALWGVLHSGPIGDYSTSWYSPLDNVESDLGYLDVACPSSPASCYPPVFATVSGPTSVSGSGVKVWTGSASGGTGSYSMAWDHRINHSEGTCLYQTSWQQVGTGTSYSRYVLSTDYDFQLRLRVTSGSQTVHEYHWVFVTSSNPPCPN